MTDNKPKSDVDVIFDWLKEEGLSPYEALNKYGPKYMPEDNKPKQTAIEREVDNWQADQWQPNADGPGPRIYPEAAFEAGIRRGIEMAAERLEADGQSYAADKVRKLLSE